MNVLVLEYHASPSAGGAESSMWNFIRHLQQDHKVLLVTSENSSPGSAPGINKESRGLPLEALTIRTLPGFVKSVLALRKMIRENSIDVVLTHLVHVSPLLRLVRWLTGCRVVIYFKWVGTMDDVGRKIRWGNGGVDQAMPLRTQ